jgi:hypothetical protein
VGGRRAITGDECRQNANYGTEGEDCLCTTSKLPAWRMAEVELKGDRGWGRTPFYVCVARADETALLKTIVPWVVIPITLSSALDILVAHCLSSSGGGGGGGGGRIYISPYTT